MSDSDFSDAGSLTDSGDSDFDPNFYNDNLPPRNDHPKPPPPILPYDRFKLRTLILDTADVYSICLQLPNTEQSMVCLDCGGVTGPDLGDLLGCECEVQPVFFMDKPLRAVWPDIEHSMTIVYSAAYEYLVTLGVDSYEEAGRCFTHPEVPGSRIHFGLVIFNTLSGMFQDITITSNLPSAYPL